MKRKIVIMILIILIFTIAFLIVALNTSEPHFKATRNGVEVEMEDLTIEWLDENCECLTGTYLCGRKNGFVTSNDSKNCDFIRNLISCQKYSCGTYTVETWNQFK